VATINVGGAGMDEESLSDGMELLEAIILNCNRVGKFRILSTLITSEQARIVSQFCIRGRNCMAIRKKYSFQSWYKLEVFHGLLMEEVSFLFIVRINLSKRSGRLCCTLTVCMVKTQKTKM
jgi:hypothetical protein